ncbi:MAG: PAS domain S-box protein [Caldisericia bacterium]
MNQINELILKIFENAKNHFFFILKNEKIILVSKNIEEILGFQENEIMNKKIKDFFIDEGEYLKFIDYLKQISKDEFMIRLKAKNNKEKFFDILMANFQEEDSSYFVILKDVTEDKRREKLNKLLYKLSRKFFEIKNLQELLKEIHILLKEFTYAENFYIALIDESNDYIYFPYFVDLVDEKPEPRKRSGRITEYVLEKKEGILLKREEIEKLRDDGKLIFYGTCPESYIGVPLKVKDKFIGVIVIQSYEKDILYDENDLNLLNFIAENVSLMIGRILDEEVHQSLIKNINGFVYQLVAETGKFLSIEGKFEEITGYKKEDFLEGRMRYLDIIHKDDFNKLKENFDTLLEGKVSSITNLYRIFTKKGEIKWLSSSARILSKKIPQTTIIQGFVTDLTENIKLREELFETEKKFKTLFDNAPIGITLTNRDGKIVYCNPEWEKIIGYKLEEIEKLTWMDLTYQEDLKEDLDNFKKLINGEIHSYSLEKRLIRKDGKVIWIYLKVIRVDDEKGDFQFEFAMIEDITEKKKLQDALIESEERFRLFFEKNPLGVAIVDKENNYIVTNSVYRNLLGYSEDELNNLSWKDITYPEDYEKQNELFNKLKNKEIDSYMIEKRYIRKDGSIFWGLLFVSAAFNKKNEFLYSFGILRDITEEKKLRDELEEAHNKLKKSFDNILTITTKIIEKKDPYTAGHQYKVSLIATKIAEKLNLPKEKIETIKIASYLHDIGKIVVPSEVLNKAGKLTTNEFLLIQEHAQAGYDILKTSELFYPIAEIVLEHHERLNGSGYPRRLKDGEIMLEAKIIAVSDVFEAMTSHRPYRPKFSIEDALKELKENSGILYDEEIVNILINLIENKELNIIKNGN